MERGWREMPPNCPRCGSTNTKFCYYNNYSLTQPRYFCKGCRRYWTKGGSLRNVPVGGGCRKSRRGNKPSVIISSSTTSSMPYPSSAPSSCCRSTLSAFGHVMMNSHDGPSSSSSSSASTIDLALVYANFLKPKTPHQHEAIHGAHLPNNINHSNNYYDQFISPSLDQIHRVSEANMDLALLHHHNHGKQQDQGLMQNPSLYAYDDRDLVGDGNERISELAPLLLPLPGGEEVVIPWDQQTNNPHDHDQLVISSCNDRNNVENNALQSTMQDPLETEAQLSSLFNIEGCWSPIDFSGYNSGIQTPEDPTTATPTATAGTTRQQHWP